MFNKIMKWLKTKYGMHHGMVLLLVSWVGFFIHPLFGIYFSILISGWYLGREEKEAEIRGFRVNDRSTWKLGKFELPDFLMPFVLSIINILVMIRI